MTKNYKIETFLSIRIPDHLMKDDMQSELVAIRSKLSEMHEDLKRFIERSNQQHLESILKGCRSDFSNAIIGYATNEIEQGLERNMEKNCHMREACRSLFSDLLKRNIEQIRDGKVSEESISKARSKLKGLRENARYDQCVRCFSETSRILDKQVDLMHSLNIYRDKGESNEIILALSEERIVDEMIEPLSNKQRIQIMKVHSSETKTFSALSSLTGLRGGNLLFHLQKLLDCGMILQRNERGDYMITEKGYKALRGLAETYMGLNPKKPSAEINESPKVANA